MADDRKHDERLSTPGRQGGWNIPKLSIDSEAFGRFAEWIARSMGSSGFLLGMTIFIAVWIGGNVAIGANSPDPWPFLALTLLLSLQASYAAPLILLAQNRQEDRDRLSFAEDRRIAAQSRADMDFLAREIASLRMSVGEMATRDFIRGEIRDQLRELLQELESHNDSAAEEKNSHRTTIG